MELITGVREVDTVTIIILEGRLQLAGDETRHVRDIVKDLVTQGHKSLVFDLEKLQYVDSAGIGTLIACFSTARSNGAALKLLRPSSSVREALAITKLLAVFEIFEDQGQAVSSFATEAASE